MNSADAAAARPSPWLQRAREFLEANHERDLTIAQVAQAAGVSRVHLTRAYAAAYGLPPHAHLNLIRLRHALAMLERGVPIAEVAARAGFADQSHFTRRFKGAFGLTPGAWQRAHTAHRAQDAERGAICAGS